MKDKYYQCVFILGLLACTGTHAQSAKDMQPDIAELSKLNAKFIQNFINQDTVSHSSIIHSDFVCIQGSGEIVGRDEYLKRWANAYQASGYTAFDYTDESIRVFGNMALVRSKNVYTTKLNDGKIIHGTTIYTDTYIKENGKWLCVQAQITLVK